MYSEAVQDDNQGSSTGRWVPGSIMDRMIFCTGKQGRYVQGRTGFNFFALFNARLVLADREHTVAIYKGSSGASNKIGTV